MPYVVRPMSEAANTPADTDRLDARWHRALLDELCGFRRETASAGERAAARWLVEQLATAGACDARIEEEHGHQTFWWPLGLAVAGGVFAGVRGMGGRRI